MKERIKDEGTSTRPRGREEQINGLILWKDDERERDEGGRREKHCLIAVLLKR